MRMDNVVEGQHHEIGGLEGLDVHADTRVAQSCNRRVEGEGKADQRVVADQGYPGLGVFAHTHSPRHCHGDRIRIGR